MSAPSPQPRRPAGLLPAIELALKLRLVDRRLWLLAACGLFVTLTLTLVQARTQGFDTLQLMSRLSLVVECTLLLSAWLLAAGSLQAREAHRLPRRHLALGLSGGVVLLLQLAVQLLPLLYFHQYPELAEEGVRVPLMLLQRGLLLVLGILATYHVMLGLRLQLRLPAWVAGPAGLLLYAWASLSFTRLSQHSSAFGRLNDLFYWNQLWLHLPTFPKLQTDYWTHNIEGTWLGYYLLLAGGAALLTLVFWVPAAFRHDAREMRASTVTAEQTG